MINFLYSFRMSTIIINFLDNFRTSTIMITFYTGLQCLPQWSTFIQFRMSVILLNLLKSLPTPLIWRKKPTPALLTIWQSSVIILLTPPWSRIPCSTWLQRTTSSSSAGNSSSLASCELVAVSLRHFSSVATSDWTRAGKILLRCRLIESPAISANFENAFVLTVGKISWGIKIT